jgi:general secretion pathway protein K
MSRGARGAALLTALLVVALAALLVAGLLDRGEAALARTRHLARAAQADALARGLEDWAIDLLLQDRASSAASDTRGDVWAQPLPPTPVPGGTIAGVMSDRNGCLNVNELAASEATRARARSRFERLLRVLKLDPALAQAMADWVDADFEPGLRGAEDGSYLGARPPYRAANRPIAHASELRLVRGIDQEAWRRLAPHVCALPRGARLNVNTASMPVLMALDERISEPIARQLWSEGAARFDSLEAFTQQLEQLGVSGVPLADLDVRSESFVARADIELDGIPFRYEAHIERPLQRGGIAVVARLRAQ